MSGGGYGMELAMLARGELFVLNYLMMHKSESHPKELSREWWTARLGSPPS